MLVSLITRTVHFSIRHPWMVMALALVLTVASSYYAATNFVINTDINTMISPSLDWRQRELTFEREFPGSHGTTLAVIEAPTTEQATLAANALTERLQGHTGLFKSVLELGGDEFFARNGLLFQSEDEVARTTKGLAQSGPLIGTLAGDPSLRGLTRALSFGLMSVQGGMAKLDDLVRPLTMSADTIEDVLEAKPASFSWRVLLTGDQPTAQDLRRFIEVQPVLDFSALESGGASTEAIRKAVADLDLASKYQARVRLTGSVPMADDEFSTIRHGALVNSLATVVVVLVILWLALRSPRIILAVALNLFVGLSVTAALGLMMVGALNMISVAFAVLFVGLGVDFGIQFAVRYRSERHDIDDLKEALISTAYKIGAPLTLAAAAVAAGFLSFLPTDYRGVSELGQIAGVGMLIAFFTSITLLPALLTWLNLSGEPEAVGYRALAPVDRFLARNRVAVIGGTCGVVLLGAPLLFFLSFDFNPINLRSPEVESVATYLDLRKDASFDANSVNVVTPSLRDANAAAEELRKLPQVERTQTLQSFVPDNQPRKLTLIRGLERQLGPVLQAEEAPRHPSDAQTVAALKSTADTLTRLAGNNQSPGAEAARRLSSDLVRLASADQAMRSRVEDAFIVPLGVDLTQLRGYLRAEPVTIDKLPASLASQWVLPDGRARVSASPKGDPNDTETLRIFARAVLDKFPHAVGGPISILLSGETVTSAFLQAGGYALVSIAILLWIVLRRFGDVLLTLVPLLLAGVVTLEICVLIGLPLNFANIISLPLLLGIGVAFKIYYIMAWRAGQTDLLQSSLTRAVIWSALTTATAFGSLWLSDHPGTSSMGKLLALSLVCTLAAAVLFQPALMGKPRTNNGT